MENKHIKKILENTRESEIILTFILALVISMLIGLCAYAANTTEAFNALQEQIIHLQDDINDIE